MEQLFDRLTKFLGQSPDSESFRGFVAEQKEPPVVSPIVQDSDDYMFSHLGVRITTNNGSIAHITLTTGTSSELQPYSGELPGGISTKDNKDAVESKLGAPTSSKLVPFGNGVFDTHESYELPNVKLSFIFAGVTGEMVLIGLSPLRAT